jgi:type IV pilus assembly protein PilF
MRPRRLATVMLVSGLVFATGCASMSRKFTFMRPDLSRRDFTRTAPEYDIRPDRKGQAALDARGRLMLADQRLRAGQYDQAEVEARAALKLDPKSARAHTILAVVADSKGQPAQAGGHYAKAAALSPADGSMLNNYGAWLCSNGRAAESIAWFDRALAAPGYATPASARANAGACAVDAGQPQRAERDLRLALTQQPGNPAALAAMARLAFDAGRYMEARAFSERRLAAAPAAADNLRLASQIEQKLGDNAASARYLQQLSAQFPQRVAQPGETADQ